MIGFGKRLSYATRCFFAVLSRGEVPEDIAPEVARSTAPSALDRASETPALPVEQAEAAPAEDATDRAVQLLALLQRDGRLVDFLHEDITPYQDAQVGAAVRELHANCRKSLEQYVRLEPIMEGEEDGPVTVEEGFEPASVKLTGNVTGRPPLRGLLRHRGWRVKEINLPSLSPRGAGRAVVAPAEVEIQ
ncbi:MAG: hypothetical protein QOH49_3152 [Acidobacteriota bacterium]|jgi:hypothetical protein|nr:hypothetical protein [Acidobacteriota bacterium]